MRQRIKKLLREERGITDLFALLYCLLITVSVVWTLFMGYKAFLVQQVLSEIARKGILMMEMEGGMTQGIRSSMEEELHERGLEGYRIVGTQAPVDFRGDIELLIEYPYPFFKTGIRNLGITIPLGGQRNSISLRNPR